MDTDSKSRPRRTRARTARDAVTAAHSADPSAANETIAEQIGFHASTVARYRKRIAARPAATTPPLRFAGLAAVSGAAAPPALTPGVHEMLADCAAAAFSACFDEDSDGFDPQIRRAGPHHDADYQANGFIAESRRRGRNPVDVAASAARRIGGETMIERAYASGPGFVNMTLSDSFVASRLTDPAAETMPPPRPARVVVDYSSPNVAKEMHVGHLRSTIIGDALVRMFEFDGAEVLPQNHIGDWGTPFGMLIEHLSDSATVSAPGDLAPAQMGDLYRAARARFDADSEFRDRSRRRVVLLQAGDRASVEAWETLRAASCAHFAQIYRDLGVLLEDGDVRGESAYQATLPEVVAELEHKNLVEESDGALCAFPAGFTARDGSPLALIVRKADGGYGYAATDLAAIRYRTQQLGATHLVYVVGSPQATHLSMVFAVARAARWLDGAQISHAAFGSVLGPDGKMLKSRDGDAAPLSGLIDAAVEQVRGVSSGRDGVADAEIAAIAVSALKYADLSTDRTHDYTFDPERMASWDGNTGPYLLYAHTRATAVLRRAAQPPDASGSAAEVQITHPAERQLALQMLDFDHNFDIAMERLTPQVLCAYAYSLARCFTRFYEECPILADQPPETTGSRLELCRLAALRLRLVLSLIGIETVERM